MNSHTHTVGSENDLLFRFGVIADPQYAPIAPDLRLNRYYAESLTRLREAIDVFNRQKLAFVITLGDLIDRGWESYDHILPLYEKLEHPYKFLLGNHDFDVDAAFLSAVAARLGLQKPYYDFTQPGGYRFVVLDGNDISVFAPRPDDVRRQIAQQRMQHLAQLGGVNAQPWNGSLSDEQVVWLRSTLKKASDAEEKVIIFNHYPIFPYNEHCMFDSKEILAIICEHENVRAYFCGHNHDGDFGVLNEKFFLNFKGMVTTASENAFAIVEVYNNRIKVRGFGREPTRFMELPYR